MTGGSPSVLRPAGPVAAAIAEMAWVLFIGGGIVFLGVMLLLALALRRNPAPLRPGRWLIGGGLALPLVVLAALGAYTAWRTHTIAAAADAGLVVRVVAKMWWWEVIYRDPASGREIVTANEIRLPTGRDITLGLASDDVIHSFWVPALAGKVDMLPGRTHPLRVRIDAPGIHRGQCAEFCGEQHARMALQVVALEPAAFDRWLAAQSRDAAKPADATARRGLAVFERERCIACHHVRGLGEGATLGPDLTHVGSRLMLGAATVPGGDRAAFVRWVGHVQQLKPGARMPSYDRLSTADMDALAAFLEQLK